MSNRCFLSSSTLRLYLLIFCSAVEQCRGLEKCCPVDNGGQRLLCLQSDIICEVFSGTSCCTLAPHCHRDLHPWYQHHTPPPALINTDLLDSFSATLQVQVIWNTRWRLWRDGEKLCGSGSSVLPPIFLPFLTHSWAFIPGFRILQEMQLAIVCMAPLSQKM